MKHQDSQLTLSVTGWKGAPHSVYKGEMTVLSLRTGGALLGKSHRGYMVTVIDMAHKPPEAQIGASGSIII